ncbi:50S ribosomal protein L22 [Candidatus Gracilibacteria bacterium]|nr:50S ribosomal protein L22 [Candidatus Gracilibacteria bacterium]
MKAHLKQIRISPKKTNVVAGLVRGKSVIEALNILKFTPKKAAQYLYKVLHSAVSNAENNDSQKREDLLVKEIIVNKGLVLKRFLPSTRGRALPLQKPTTHISVILEKNTTLSHFDKKKPLNPKKS